MDELDREDSALVLSSARVALRALVLFSVPIAIVVAVLVGRHAGTAESEGGAAGTQGEAGPLVPLGADLSSYIRASSRGWYVAVPFTLRNPTSSAIVIRHIKLEHVVGADVDLVGVVGPQSPSLTNMTLTGWPVEPIDAAFALKDFLVRPPRGFRIPAGPRSGSAKSIGPHRLVVDQPNDASIAVKMRMRDPVRAAFVRGVTVEYELDGSVFVVRIPSIEFGLCPEADFARSQCGQG